MIGRMMTTPWSMAEREELAAKLEAMDTDVVVTFGAGNIDVTCAAIAEVIGRKSIEA
jgi:UDP-N-acetylmuramate--alanine ligase